ncbi:MAG: GtrA family protein [Anaerolineae bacterium]
MSLLKMKPAIYTPFIKNIASSLLSAAVDITAFMLLINLGSGIFPATVVARLISGVFNFALNKIWVFHMKNSHNTRREFLKYLALFITQMLFSGLLTQALDAVFDFRQGLLLSKIVADVFLFTTNFVVQRFWIFSARKMELCTER